MGEGTLRAVGATKLSLGGGWSTSIASPGTCLFSSLGLVSGLTLLTTSGRGMLSKASLVELGVLLRSVGAGASELG